MVTMFGWLSRASTRPSRLNRSANAGSVASDCGRIFSATKRSILDCRALKTKPIPPCPMSSRISSCGKAAANSSCVGGADLENAPFPASVGMEACNKRHLGQSPCGASAGIGSPHFGQNFDSDAILILLPEATVSKGYTLFHATTRHRLELVPKPGSAGILAGENRREREENHAGKDAGAPRFSVVRA